MNLILMREGYPPAVIMHLDRKNIIEYSKKRIVVNPKISWIL
ncbi:hypothetical protein LEP1GSC150_5450 [Leptospira interrogans serovar Copenhageni str. LT2050]|uniref:Uncharacterized protein n=1 Tax=Leptospira interrogans serovar Copenhageni str. LT2050 TaxID=1001598 RepID=M3IRE1_LEPIT|nr:hypothetical protein LEP1GSC150_5450 [Leptospira interrogans serovar Copenhageni str. LT2050]